MKWLHPAYVSSSYHTRTCHLSDGRDSRTVSSLHWTLSCWWVHLVGVSRYPQGPASSFPDRHRSCMSLAPRAHAAFDRLPSRSRQQQYDIATALKNSHDYLGGSVPDGLFSVFPTLVCFSGRSRPGFPYTPGHRTGPIVRNHPGSSFQRFPAGCASLSR